MSVRYTIEDLKAKREAAGLGVLSMGVCALSGELVSSTPIPGSRCGHAGQNTAEYGGYLLGEGMTPATALYLANLHNHFPELAEAVEKRVDEWDQDAVAYLERISKIAREQGWGELDGTLFEWLQLRLRGNENRDACIEATLEENRLLKDEACRYYLADGTFKVFEPEVALEMRKAAARELTFLQNGIEVLREQLDEARAQRDEEKALREQWGCPAELMAQAREEGRLEERERILRVLLDGPVHRFAYVSPSHPTDIGCAAEFFWFGENIVRFLLKPAPSEVMEVADEASPF